LLSGRNKINSGDLEMYVRLIFTVAIFFASIAGGFGPRPAHAAFCTVEDIMNGYHQGVPLEDIVYVCDQTDVRCDAITIFDKIDGGLTLEDIYYECE
jgi:hypothetical protein